MGIFDNWGFRRMQPFQYGANQQKNMDYAASGMLEEPAPAAAPAAPLPASTGLEKQVDQAQGAIPDSRGVGHYNTPPQAGFQAQVRAVDNSLAPAAEYKPMETRRHVVQPQQPQQNANDWAAAIQPNISVHNAFLSKSERAAPVQMQGLYAAAGASGRQLKFY